MLVVSWAARQPWRPAARRASRRVRIRPHRAVDRATDRHRAAQATGRPPAAPSAARVVRNPRTTTANSSRALWCFRWTGEWHATVWKERPDKRPHLTPGRHRQWPRVPTAMLSRRPSCIRPVQLVPASSSPLEAVLAGHDTTRSSGADLSRSIVLFRMDHPSDDHDITYRGGAR